MIEICNMLLFSLDGCLVEAELNKSLKPVEVKWALPSLMHSIFEKKMLQVAPDG